MSIKIWSFAIVALVSTALLAGCGKGGFSERKQEEKKNMFRYPIVTNPTTLDPGVVEDGDTIDLLQQVYEGLVAWGEDNQIKPRLAEKWEIQDGGRTYVFTLKKGVKFHNGRELTAEDLKWSMERNCRSGVKSSTVALYLDDIVGFKQMIEGKADALKGIEVKDPHTLIIKLDQPRPYFLGKLTYLTSAAIAKESVPGDSEINDPKQMVGTGPFKVVEYAREQRIVLEANKDYHEGAPSLEKLERPVIKDPMTRLNKYKAGEVDLVTLARNDIPAVKGDPNLSSHLKLFDRPAIWYIGLNQKAYAPFKDRRVRRAFAMAIDKEKIVKELLGGVNTLAGGILPPGVLGHRPDAKGLSYNPEEAKKLLAEAGFAGGKGLPAVELTFREGYPDVQIAAEAAASQLRQNLGIDVKLKTMEWRAYLEKWNRSEIGFFHMRWAADYLDPQNFLSILLASYGAQNKVGYANPEFDKRCREADGSMDTEKRLRLYAEAEDIVLQDVIWIPLYFQRDAELIRPRVKGMRESLFGHLPHTKVRLED